MPTDIASYKNIKYGAASQFGKTNSALHQGGGGGFDISQIASMMPSGGGDKKEEKKGEPVYNYRTGKTETTPSAFKLKSGNTTSFKEMGSSPTKFWGGMFGGGGGLFGGGGIRGIMDKIRAKREARRAKRLGLTATAPGGGDGAHTHGTGGEPIGGAQAAAPAEAAVAPEMPAEGLDEEAV